MNTRSTSPTTFWNERKLYLLLAILIFTTITTLVILLFFVQSQALMFILFIFLFLTCHVFKILFDKIKLLLSEMRSQDEVEPNLNFQNLRQRRLEHLPVRDMNRMRLLLRDGDFTPEDYEDLLALDDENELKFLKGASLSDIKRLPQLQIPKLTQREKGELFCSEKLAKILLEKSCPICLEEFVELDFLITVPCFHQFHKDCISKWLQQNATCPVCHHNVF